MPYPVSCSFSLPIGNSSPDGLLAALRAAAVSDGLPILAGEPDALVVGGAPLFDGEDRDRPMRTVTRCRLELIRSRSGSALRVTARFDALAGFGALGVIAPWCAAFLRSPRNAVAYLDVAVAVLAGFWLLLYLCGMLDVRLWARTRLRAALEARGATAK